MQYRMCVCIWEFYDLGASLKNRKFTGVIIMDYSNATNEQLEQLVNNKDGYAICELADRCIMGSKGHEKNLTRAYQLYHKGEKMGLSEAYKGLAVMYEYGIYMVRNQNLSAEYCNKAGIAYPPPNPFDGGIQPPPNPLGGGRWSPSVNELPLIIRDARAWNTSAEEARRQGDYYRAKELSNNVIKKFNDMLGRTDIAIQENEKDEIDDLKISAYWTLAYTAYNEQQFTEMDMYLAQEDVIAVHPWGAYLRAVAHRITQAPQNVLQQDLQLLVKVSNNYRLSKDEKGDVCQMIGDLIMDGAGNVFNYDRNNAYEYYKIAAECGNAYAGEQLSKL